MIKIVPLIKRSSVFGYIDLCNIYYKKDNNSSISVIFNKIENIEEDYTRLDGLYNFNLFSKELKDLEGNLVDLEELVKA